jgi:hypothetical protein
LCSLAFWPSTNAIKVWKMCNIESRDFGNEARLRNLDRKMIAEAGKMRLFVPG